jgi:hypothetical protein
MHKTIKRFGFEGEIGDDADFARLRTMYEKMIVDDMRENGYVPVLDLGPYWSTSYVQKRDSYDFMLSVYGIYVGRRRSWQIEGMVNGRELKKYIPPTKSQQQ